MINGWLILDKPLGLGSTQGVSAVKRALREAGEPKHRIGHGGTLDPLATGVLPIAIGEATKLAGRMLDATKVYDFTIGFGAQTDTLDLEGVIIATSDARPTLAAIEAILPRFTGPIEQVPPNYSALKVDGKRAYDMARAGLELELLARDIAIALGTVGHVTMLRRTKAGPFDLSHAISLDKLADLAKARSLDGAVLPLSAGLDDIPALPVTPAEATLLRHGQKLTRTLANAGLYLATDDDRPVALVEAGPDGLTVVRGFNI
jgi:tRNA pseudouridine55 synthase